jgi:rod shape-determining protein MreC
MGAYDKRRMFTGTGVGPAEVSRRIGILPRVLVIGALALLMASRANPPAVEPLREAILTVTRPVISGVSAVLHPVADSLGRWLAAQAGDDTVATAAEPPSRQIAALSARLDSLERENQALRALMPAMARTRHKLLPAAVIGASSTPVSSMMLLGAGRDHGLKPGYPVLSGERLAGRVLQVHASTATAIRLSDRLSRVPVLVGSGQLRAIMAGAGDGSALLELVSPGQALAAGDVVITSGIGGVFPKGLLAGTLVATATGGWKVEFDSADDYPAAVGVLEIEGAVFEPADPAGRGGVAGPIKQAGRAGAEGAR